MDDDIEGIHLGDGAYVVPSPDPMYTFCIAIKSYHSVVTWVDDEAVLTLARWIKKLDPDLAELMKEVL